jgi:hypothetical protein
MNRLINYKQVQKLLRAPAIQHSLNITPNLLNDVASIKNLVLDEFKTFQIFFGSFESD